MNKNHIQPERSGDSLPAERCRQRRHGGASWHNAAKPVGEAVEVNVVVVRRRTATLPGEISTARGRESGSAGRSNALGDGREPERSGDSLPAKRCRQLSRGHSTVVANRGDERCPINCATRKRDEGKGRTDPMGRPGHPPETLNPTGGVPTGYGNRVEPERGEGRRPGPTDSRRQTESPCGNADRPRGMPASVRHPAKG